MNTSVSGEISSANSSSITFTLFLSFPSDVCGTNIMRANCCIPQFRIGISFLLALAVALNIVP